MFRISRLTLAAAVLATVFSSLLYATLGPAQAKGGGAVAAAGVTKARLVSATDPKATGDAQFSTGAVHDTLLLKIKLPGAHGAIDVQADGTTIGSIELDAAGQGAGKVEPAHGAVSPTATISVGSLSGTLK